MRGSVVARTGLLALLLVAVTACPISPKYVRPDVPLNASWSADPRLAAKAAADVAWWHSFHDPTLDHLIELAYQQNLPLQIAGLRIIEARAQLGIAIGQQYPTNPSAIGSASLDGLNSHPSGAPDLDLLAGRYLVGFDALWEIDFWGKYRRGVKAARATWFATVADYDNALVSLTAEVARTYALVRTFQVLIELARQNVVVQEDGQRIAESRFRNGATSELDVNQATSLLETTRASIPSLEIDLQQASNALCTLLGRATGCVPALVGGPGAIPVPPAQVEVSVPTEMLRRRPDIRGAELRAIAQCDRIGVAKTDLFPKLMLFGSIGTQTVQSSGAPMGVANLLNLFNPGTLVYSIGVNLFWPILAYPQIISNVRVQDARLQELLVDYQQTVLGAAQQVEDGIVGFVKQQDASGFQKNAVDAAQKALNAAMVQYREGATDFQRVVDSERALLQAQNALARTQSAVATNLVALYKALGGGWELRAGQPVVTDKNRVEMAKRTNWGGSFAPPTHR